jgi:hypothetical protein
MPNPQPDRFIAVLLPIEGWKRRSQKLEQNALAKGQKKTGADDQPAPVWIRTASIPP